MLGKLKNGRSQSILGNILFSWGVQIHVRHGLVTK